MKIPFNLSSGKKKFVIITILAVVAFLAFNNFTKPKTQDLQFAEVKKADITQTISSSGSLTGKNVVDLKFRSSGKLAYLNVKIGDEVLKNQTIAALDAQQLNIDLQQAQNTLREKQAAAEKVEDDVKDHSKDETFKQKSERTTAQVARDNAYDSLKEARRAFQDIELVSPIAGLITQANFIPGQIIGTSDLIAQIVDFSQIFFDTEIDEADIGKVSNGQKAEVILDAYPDKILEGIVEEIIPQTKTTSSGATVVTVRINIGTPAITPIKGLSGQASIILSRAQNALVIPLEALREDESAIMQTSEGLKSQKVKTGIKSDTDVEILEGLSEKDKVLLNPPK